MMPLATIGPQITASRRVGREQEFGEVAVVDVA